MSEDEISWVYHYTRGLAFTVIAAQVGGAILSTVLALWI